MDKNNKRSIRSAFGNTLAEIGERNSKIVVLDADLSCSTQTQIFAKKFPERFFDCGIAEQDMLATAAGLASEGKIPDIIALTLCKLYLVFLINLHHIIMLIFIRIYDGKFSHHIGCMAKVFNSCCSPLLPSAICCK